MYSSLPSASKIYVSSAKSRQKSASSAKRRRKKVEANPNNANNSDETLISLANKNDLEHDASSVLHSNISESSQSHWEKDDSSSDLSLPTVKVNRRQSRASSGKSRDETIMESPKKIVGDDHNVLENRIEISPAKESDDDFVSDNYEQSAEITNERCKLSVRKDSLLSPIKSKNNLKNEYESNLKHLTNEHIEAQPLENTEETSNSSEREIIADDHTLDASNTDISSEHEENNVLIPPLSKNVENSLGEGNHDVHSDVNANVSSQSSLDITENLKENHDEDELPTESNCHENMDEKNPEIHLSKDSLVRESVPHKNSARMHSPEPSEKSCTESLMSESRVSQPEITPAESKSSVGYPEFDDEKKRGHSNICQSYSDLGRAKCPSLHRFPSWPSNLDYSKNFYRTPVSKTASFSDKATYTVDLLPAKCDKESSSDDMTWNVKDDSVETESKSVSSKFQEVAQKIVPPLGMLQARSRSYVFGSMGPKGSLLGSDELNRLFPDNQVTVFIGTWNMNGQNPPENIDDFLLPLGISTLPDIYAIGIQEGSQSRSEWEILLQTTLGPSHVLFTSSSLGVLHLSVFLRRDLIWFCSEPEDASVATRPGAMVKTKGAVAVCFMFFGTSFLFVNSHLTGISCSNFKCFCCNPAKLPP